MFKRTISLVAVAALVFALAGPAMAVTVYWDIDGAVAGSGPDDTPAGTWDAVNTFWNDTADGTGTVAAWSGGDTAVFAAGADATGTYTVTVDKGTTHDVGGLIFEEGSVEIKQGSGVGDAVLLLNGDVVMTAAGTDGKTYKFSGGLDWNLNGATRTFNIAANRTFHTLYGSDVKDDTGGVKIIGGGTFNWDIKPNWNGTLIVEEGVWTTGQQFNDALKGATVTLGGAGGKTGTIQNTRSWGPTAGNAFTLATGGTGRFSMTVAGYYTGLSGVISGDGSLDKVGAGGLVLSGTNSYAGGTTVTEGLLVFRKKASKPAGDATTVAAAGGLGLGVGGAEFTSTDLDNLFGNTLAGVTMNAASHVGIDTTPGGITYALPNGNTRAVVVLGAKALTLNGATTSSGNVTLAGGTLNINHAGALGSGNVTLAGGTLNINHAQALGTGTFTIAGGTINNTSGGAITNSNNNAMVWNQSFNFGGTNDLNLGTGAVTLGTTPALWVAAGTLTVGGNIGGAGKGLNKLKSGTLVLTGNNTYTGQTKLGNFGNQIGVLRADDGVGLPTLSALQFDVGVFETGIDLVRPSGSGAGQMQSTRNKWPVGFSAYGGPINVCFGAMLAAPENLTWGASKFTQTALILNHTAANDTLDFKNPIDLGNAQRSVQVNATDSAAIATMSGVLSGAGGGLEKKGVGTLVLSGTNTYTGATNVNTGTLLVNGDQTAATGAVTVASGATLGGSGTIGGAVTVNSGGTLSPGASAGTLTVNDDLTFADGGNTWIAELLGAAADRVTVTGTLTLGDATDLELVFGGADPFQAGTYTLASYANLVGAGAFSSVTDLGDYTTGTGVAYGANAITITLDASLLAGDATLDRTVDLDDFARLRNNYGTGDTWAEADFNGDDTVNLDDFAILRNNYGSHVPEPATLAILAMGGAWLAFRRRRHGTKGTSVKSALKKMAGGLVAAVLALVVAAGACQAAMIMEIQIDVSTGQAYIFNPSATPGEWASLTGYAITSAGGYLLPANPTLPVGVGEWADSWLSLGDQTNPSMPNPGGTPPTVANPYYDAAMAIVAGAWALPELSQLPTDLSGGTLAAGMWLDGGGSVYIGKVVAPPGGWVVGRYGPGPNTPHSDLAFRILEDGATASEASYVNLVPEPATLALLGLGGLATLIRRRKRR